MRIIILHGENTDKSYGRLKQFIGEAKRRGWEIIYDDVAATSSLFGKERLFVIKDYKLLPKNLSTIPGTLVVYWQGNLPVGFLNKLKGAKIEKYDLPKLLWNFLSKPTVAKFHEVIKTEPIELVFHLLAKRLRNTKYLDTLSRIDYEAKTGKVNLVTSLDLFIAKHLE